MTPPVQEDGFEARFRAAMDDDFNTPEAMAVLFDLAREVNRLQESDRAAAGPARGPAASSGRGPGSAAIGARALPPPRIRGRRAGRRRSGGLDHPEDRGPRPQGLAGGRSDPRAARRPRRGAGRRAGRHALAAGIAPGRHVPVH